MIWTLLNFLAERWITNGADAYETTKSIVFSNLFMKNFPSFSWRKDLVRFDLIWFWIVLNRELFDTLTVHVTARQLPSNLIDVINSEKIQRSLRTGVFIWLMCSNINSCSVNGIPMPGLHLTVFMALNVNRFNLSTNKGHKRPSGSVALSTNEIKICNIWNWDDTPWALIKNSIQFSLQIYMAKWNEKSNNNTKNNSYSVLHSQFFIFAQFVETFEFRVASDVFKTDCTHSKCNANTFVSWSSVFGGEF